jgi:hypothetical protein
MGRADRQAERAAAEVVAAEGERLREEAAARWRQWWERAKDGTATLNNCVLSPATDIGEGFASTLAWVFVPAGKWRVLYLDDERIAIEYHLEFQDGSGRWEVGVFLRCSVWDEDMAPAPEAEA